MPWTTTGSGLKLWIKDDGKALVRDASGKVYSTTPEKAERLVLDQGYSSASPEQRAAQVEQIQQGGIGGQVAAGAKAFAAGVVDIGAAGYRVGEAVGETAGKAIGRQMGISEEELARRAKSMPRISQALGGRELQENVAAVVGHLRGQESEVAAREYRETAQAQARQNPITTEGAYLAGQVLPTLGVGALGAGAAKGMTLGTRVALGAIEAGGQGASQVTEDAFVKDQEITSEQVLAGAGLGAVLGGTATLGMYGAGRAFRRIGSRGATPFDAAVPGYKVARDDAAREVAEGALGGEAPTKQTVGWLRRQFTKGVEKYEELSGVVTGASKEDLGALRLRDVVEGGAESPFKRFDQRAVIRKQYTDELAEVQQRVQEAEQRLFKQNIVEARKADQMRLLVDNTPEALERQRTAVADMATSLERAVDDMASNPRAYGERAWLDPMRDEVDRLRQKLIDPKADGAELFTSVDRIKRKMDRYVRKARGQQARGSGDFAKDFQAGNLAERLSTTQEPIRRGLMNPEIWGQKAAQSQREINAAWESHLGDVSAGITDPNESYLKAFFGRHKGLYEDELPTFRVEKEKVLGFLREMGSEASVTARDTEAQMLRQLDTGTGLAKSLEKHYHLGPELQKDVGAIVDGNQQIRTILDRIRGEMKTFQQIDRLEGLQGQVGGLGVGAVGGGVLGGPVGAVAGAAYGAANMPVRIARQAWALKALAKNVQRKMRGEVSAVASGTGEAIGPPRTMQELKARIYARRAKAAAEDEYEQGLGPWGAPAPKPSARVEAPQEVFGPARLPPLLAGEATRRIRAKDGSDDWRDQAEMVMALGDPSHVSEMIAQGLGTLADDLPATSGMVAQKAAVGAQYLSNTLGPMIPPRPPMQPNMPLDKLPPDDQERWDRIWNAVNDPMSVLQDWRTGQVQQDQLDALRAVWPRIFEDLRDHTAELVAARKTPLGYDESRQLELLLDLGGALEPTLAPQFMARTNDWYQAGKGKEQATARPSAKAPDVSSLHELHPRET